MPDAQVIKVNQTISTIKQKLEASTPAAPTLATPVIKTEPEDDLSENSSKRQKISLDPFTRETKKALQIMEVDKKASKAEEKIEKPAPKIVIHLNGTPSVVEKPTENSNFSETALSVQTYKPKEADKTSPKVPPLKIKLFFPKAKDKIHKSPEMSSSVTKFLQSDNLLKQKFNLHDCQVELDRCDEEVLKEASKKTLTVARPVTRRSAVAASPQKVETLPNTTEKPVDEHPPQKPTEKPKKWIIHSSPKKTLLTEPSQAPSKQTCRKRSSVPAESALKTPPATLESPPASSALAADPKESPPEAPSTSQLVISSVRTITPNETPVVTIKTEPGVPHQPIKRIVSHLSYTIVNHTLDIRCKLCNFGTDSIFAFKQHALTSHRNQRWFGTCRSCNRGASMDKMSGKVEPLYSEFKHLYDVHLTREHVSINQSKSNPSTRVALHDKPPMVSIPGDLKALSKIIDVKDFQLRPWLSMEFNRKHQSVAKASIASGSCLSALFKCMSVDCEFFTSDEHIFRKHLSLHQYFQVTDRKNFSCCAYCEFSHERINGLIEHIKDVHGADCYQCSLCFYRSYDMQVVTHMKLFHSQVRIHKVIKVYPIKQKDKNKELEKAWEECEKFVPQLNCSSELKKFENLMNFR
jgi:hypothetical protein